MRLGSRLAPGPYSGAYRRPGKNLEGPAVVAVELSDSSDAQGRIWNYSGCATCLECLKVFVYSGGSGNRLTSISFRVGMFLRCCLGRCSDFRRRKDFIRLGLLGLRVSLRCERLLLSWVGFVGLCGCSMSCRVCVGLTWICGLRGR